MPDVQTFSTPDKLMCAAAEDFAATSEAAIAERGRCFVLLAGGSTPKTLYSLLASDPWRDRIDWLHVHLFWGDERCVPPDHPESNYCMAREALLDHLDTPTENIHRIRGEHDADTAANMYDKELRSIEQSGDGRPFPFDWALLGMGDDGHTASIFPGSPALSETRRRVMAVYVDHLRAWRVTCTPLLINAARRIVFLVSGESKAERLRDVLFGSQRPERWPSQSIKPTAGLVTWLLDRAAATQLRQ